MFIIGLGQSIASPLSIIVTFSLKKGMRFIGPLEQKAPIVL